MLNIPYPGTFVAQSKVEGNMVGLQTPANAATVQVTLSRHETVDFIVEDYANAQANSDLLMRYVQPAAIALAEQIESDLMSLYSSFATSIGTSGTNITAALVQSARKTLNDNRAPVSNRALIVSTKDEIALLADTTLTQYFAYAENKAITEGSIGKLYGMEVFTSQLIPVVTGTPNSTKCIAMHKDAILLATRPFRDIPASSGVEASTIIDPVSGIAIRVLNQYDINNRGAHVGFDVLYGFTALRPTLGVTVLT